MRPREGAWRAIFSPDWVSICLWLVSKQGHQRSHPYVQRQSRDLFLEGRVYRLSSAGSRHLLTRSHCLPPTAIPGPSPKGGGGKSQQLGCGNDHMSSPPPLTVWILRVEEAMSFQKPVTSLPSWPAPLILPGGCLHTSIHHSVSPLGH